MARPYDQATDEAHADGFVPRRDWGAYVLLVTYLIAIGATAGVLVVRLLNLIGAM